MKKFECTLLHTPCNIVHPTERIQSRRLQPDSSGSECGKDNTISFKMICQRLAEITCMTMWRIQQIRICRQTQPLGARRLTFVTFAMSVRHGCLPESSGRRGHDKVAETFGCSRHVE